MKYTLLHHYCFIAIGAASIINKKKETVSKIETNNCRQTRERID